jgi:hypothetical protein
MPPAFSSHMVRNANVTLSGVVRVTQRAVDERRECLQKASSLAAGYLHQQAAESSDVEYKFWPQSVRFRVCRFQAATAAAAAAGRPGEPVNARAPLQNEEAGESSPVTSLGFALQHSAAAHRTRIFGVGK